MAKVRVRRRCGLAAVVDYRPGRAPLAWRTPTTRATAFSWLLTFMTSKLAKWHSDDLSSKNEWKSAVGWYRRLYGDCGVCSSESRGEGIDSVRASSGLCCPSAPKNFGQKFFVVQ